MFRKLTLRAILAATFWSAWLFAEPKDSSKPAAPADSTVHSEENGWFVIETHHRIYPDFLQVDSVEFGQPFELGEGIDTAEIIAFNPHFMITDSGEVYQLSDTLYNPAARVRVTTAGKKAQESWAFYFISAPHYHRDNFFAFKIIDFRVDPKFKAPPLKK